MGLLDIIFGKKNKEIKEEKAITLEKYISDEIKSGKDPEELRQELKKDLQESGEIFGELREQFKATNGNDLDKSDKQLYYWSGIDDNETCDNCRKMQQMEPRTWSEWEQIGMPGDNSATCGFDCRCSLAMYDPDMAKIEELHPIESRAFKALKTSKDNPQKVIDIIEPLCEKLLALGNEIEKTEELQIYYWIDNLTIALVRLKEYEKAHRWLKIAKKLPERYRERSNNSEQERINKRYLKCEEKI